MSVARSREADRARRRYRAHLKHVYGLDDDPPLHACRACRRATRGKFCYWCGKRRGLW